MNNGSGILSRRRLNRDLRQLCGTGRWVLPLIVLMLVLLSGPMTQAQTTAQLTGGVQDATGAVIPGAQVTLTDEATGVSPAWCNPMARDCMRFPRWCRAATL